MRRKLIGIFIAAALVASLSAFAQGTAAASPAATGAATSSASVAGPVKVGVINIQQVIVSTNEGKREFDALNKKFEPKQTELQNLQKEVQTLQSQLQTQGDKMNEDARATLVKQIESRQKVLQRNADDAQAEFNAQQGEVAQKILAKLGPVVDKFAKDNGYGILIDDSNPWPQGQVLWAMPSVDVSAAVIEAYNAQAGIAAPAPRPSASAPRPTVTPGGGAAVKPIAPATSKPATPAGSKPPQP